MSGTSLDGLDIANVDFHFKDNQWEYKLGPCQSISYSSDLKNRLKEAVHLTGLDLILLNNEFGNWLGEQTKKFLEVNDLNPDFVSSHGHTVFHQPEKGLTYQIGNGQELANACGQTVVCDFRSLDVSLGGQGAPLVPIGDRLLFHDYDYCLNLGGIANVSFESKKGRVAYDIGPANMLLNYLSELEGKSFDEGGELAKSGNLNSRLFDQLNNLNYYKLDFPKSTGFEWFQEYVLPIIDASEISIIDKLNTSVKHIAFQIAKNVEKDKGKRNLLITGGGAKNEFLISELNELVNGKIHIVIPSEEIIDFKEALIFAFMGVLNMRGEVNCLSSVTGAIRDNCGGRLFEPL